MPGGLAWEENQFDELADFIREVRRRGIPVSAICGATNFLCKQGFLNNIKHTGDSLKDFQATPGYKGEKLYISAQVVHDEEIVTANETAAVEFAYEILKILKIDSQAELEQWFDNFQNGLVR